MIDANLFETLGGWDTPTICNALELVMPERRGVGFSTAPFVALDPELPPIVGLAKTARIRAAAPDPMGGAGMAARVPYYEYVVDCDLPTVVVVQDLDPTPGVGAFWGEVHTAVHKGLGVRGVVTNGSFRDIADSAPGFQVLGGLVAPSHAFVHPVDFAGTVTVHGMEVASHDLVHADRHGAVVIPAEAAPKLPAMVELIARKEAVILEAARSPDFGLEALKAAIGSSADIH